ncbi:MAG: hypothetical protein M1837_004033 [Sclerophora amabilis]|nr:MAG: hypothetical protein M1837_004033 [Sclerophora amabilis]
MVNYTFIRMVLPLILAVSAIVSGSTLSIEKGGSISSIRERQVNDLSVSVSIVDPQLVSEAQYNSFRRQMSYYQRAQCTRGSMENEVSATPLEFYSPAVYPGEDDLHFWLGSTSDPGFPKPKYRHYNAAFKVALEDLRRNELSRWQREREYMVIVYDLPSQEVASLREVARLHIWSTREQAPRLPPHRIAGDADPIEIDAELVEHCCLAGCYAFATALGECFGAFVGGISC